MSHIASILLRLSLLVALVLPLGVEPVASEQAPQQAAPVSCLAVPILGKIIGTVRDSDDKPLPGVTVTAHTMTGATTASGSTDAAGAYGLPLPPGSYLIEFKPPSGLLQAIWYPSGTSQLDATLVEVGDGKTVSGLDVKLPAGAQFHITLRDPDGDPVPEGLVSVFDRYGRKVAEGQTDEEGRALTAPGLAPGGYRLFARPPYGSPLLAQYHAQKPTLDAADPLTVTQALNNVEAPMTLQRGAQLSGTVADATTGTPLAGILVEVRDAQGEARDTMTDAQGRYSVEGLPSGSYQVAFSSGRPEPSAHAPLRRLVALSAPDAQTEFDATLAQGGAISGRVIAPDGSPIPAVSIQVRDLDGAVDSHGSSAADGSYAIHGLPSGRYMIAYAGYNLQALALADPVTVTAPNTTTVAATVLRPGGAISGNVTDPDDQPVAGVYVSILDAATGVQEGYSYTNADGAYTTPTTLASGSYIVKFQPPAGDKACPLAIEYSGNAVTAAAATRVQVSAPTAVTGIDAKLDYGGHITGRITDAANGLPLFGTVQVYEATGVVVAAGTTGITGAYSTAAGLPLGAYRVQFSANGYVPLFYGGATRLEAAAPVSSGASDVGMALQRGGTLMGRITAADSGAPLEHAAVTLYDARDQVVATQLTTFDGSYRFAGDLPSGVYRVGVAPGQRADGTPSFTDYEVVFSGGASSLAQAQPISLVAPQTLSADLAMPKTTDAPPTPQPEPSPEEQRVYLPLLRR
jgi:hypothetical protein